MIEEHRDARVPILPREFEVRRTPIGCASADRFCGYAGVSLPPLDLPHWCAETGCGYDHTGCNRVFMIAGVNRDGGDAEVLSISQLLVQEADKVGDCTVWQAKGLIDVFDVWCCGQTIIIYTKITKASNLSGCWDTGSIKESPTGQKSSHQRTLCNIPLQTKGWT